MPGKAPSPTSGAPSLVWFRNDLRLADNPALTAAAAAGRPLFCFYVLEDEADAIRPLGGASKWWLAYSLASLSASLTRLGGALHVFEGAAEPVIAKLAAALKPAAVFWNRRYPLAERDVDERVEAQLKAAEIEVATFNGTLGREPWEITTQAGGYFRVYGAYARAARSRGPLRRPTPAPDRLSFAAPGEDVRGRPIESLRLLPRSPDWAGGLRETWKPGEEAALGSLKRFADEGLARYGEDRDSPSLPGSSRLSPHLRFGEVSPQQVYAAIEASRPDALESEGGKKFLGELAWRDFCYALLFHVPDLATNAFDPSFQTFPYEDPSADRLDDWRFGRTGYPIVDAGMRQLWQTGVMHNRVRMVTASFLVKHLLADWRIGEAWFWDTLCDADPANNAVNWQWVAGSGPDPAPFFRVFNPVLQGEKFDPEGIYVRRFVPELSALPARWIHKPWQAPKAELAKAGVMLGGNYPAPVVDHAQARAKALAAFRDSRVGR